MVPGRTASTPATYSSLKPCAALFTEGVPALMFHKIGGFRRGVRRRGLYVSPRSFETQMRELQRAGFRSVPMSDLPATSPPLRLAITFDDGFASALDHAAPVLGECDFRAINFLVSGQLGGVNTWEIADGERAETLMDEAQVRDWLAAGHEIGAHSVSHAHLRHLPIAAAREEIGASKKALEDCFSRAVTDFAYPFGEYDASIRSLVEEAGFERAWTVESGVVGRGTDHLALPRFPVMVSLRQPLEFLRSVLPRRRK